MAEIDLSERIVVLEKAVQMLNERNRKVEADKAWETSRMRIVSVCLVTYVVTALVFWLIGVTSYLSSALIPTIGYFLSTQTISILKARWLGARREGGL